MKRVEECPVCRSQNLSPFLSVRDYFLTGEQFTIGKCNSCGFKFTADHPGENESSRYYESDDYISHSEYPRGIVNKLYLLVRKVMLSRKVSLVMKYSGRRRGSLLDIGSGSGFFLNGMKGSGWDVTGVEINARAREHSSSRYNIEVIPPERISKIEPEKFDAITLWHVLEHFYDPVLYMEEISRILRENGVCIVALPNSDSFDALHYKEHWAAWDVPRHIWHFNPHTFNLFAEKCGFRVEAVRSLPADVFYISAISEKYKGSSSHFIKGIIRGKMFFLRSLGRVAKQSSIIYILKRKDS
jgi:SAM-dependent methyltransferase